MASRLAEDPSVSVAVIEAGFNAEHLQEVYFPSTKSYQHLKSRLKPGIRSRAIWLRYLVHHPRLGIRDSPTDKLKQPHSYHKCGESSWRQYRNQCYAFRAYRYYWNIYQ